PESMLPSISPYIATPLMHVPCGGVRNPRKMTQGQAEADSALHHHSAVAVNQYFCDRRIEGNIRSSNPESMLPSISPYIAAPLMHVHCGGVRNPHKMTQGQAEADSALHRHSSQHRLGSENA
ncbi:MAG: hypothetical protein VB026_02895, partial [Anaerolineaceae bacterium]|nr:hypothetical protein [Anaerolineaceae bacterium]